MWNNATGATDRGQKTQESIFVTEFKKTPENLFCPFNRIIVMPNKNKK